MKRQIFIYFHTEHQQQQPADVSWIVQESGRSPGPVFHGNLQDASNHAMGCRVIVLVPAEMVTMTQVDLPAMNRQRLIKAIPFALEEQVAGDVEKLHFSVGQRDDKDLQSCAIVETETVSMWLDALKEFNIQPDVITTEVSAVPIEAHTWTLMFNDINRPETKVLLRTSTYSGLAIDLANVTSIITMLVNNAEEDDLPDQLRIITCEDVTQEPSTDEGKINQETTSSAIATIIGQLRELCDEKSIAIERHDTEDGLLTNLAQGFEEPSCINILQGQFSRKERIEKLLRPWRTAAAVGFVWLVLQVGLLVTEYRELLKQDSQLRSDIVAVYKDAFPDARNIVDPRLQMQRGLDELRQGGKGGSDMFMLLSRAGEILQDTDTLNIRGVRYKKDELDIDIEIADLQALDELKIRLAKEAELQVEIVSASARGGKVESRLQIKTT